MLRPKLLDLSFSSNFHLYSSLLLLVVFLSLLICPKDTVPLDDVSSPNDVSELVIVIEKQKSPTDGFRTPVGVEFGVFKGWLEQIQILSPADGRPPIIDPQLAENVFRVCAKGIGRDD